MWNLGILTMKSKVSISGCSWSVSLGWLCLGVGGAVWGQLGPGRFYCSACTWRKVSLSHRIHRNHTWLKNNGVHVQLGQSASKKIQKGHKPRPSLRCWQPTQGTAHDAHTQHCWGVRRPPELPVLPAEPAPCCHPLRTWAREGRALLTLASAALSLGPCA